MDLLVSMACSARANAYCRRSNLRVGSAVLDTKNNIHIGANIEVLWQRCYHAEENAIITCKTHDGGDVVAVCIACERELFTPCGSCMDVILEFSTPNCIVAHYNPATRKLTAFRAKDLMPVYPTRS